MRKLIFIMLFASTVSAGAGENADEPIQLKDG